MWYHNENKWHVKDEYTFKEDENVYLQSMDLKWTKIIDDDVGKWTRRWWKLQGQGVNGVHEGEGGKWMLSSRVVACSSVF